jgi:hypothetical protein
MTAARRVCLRQQTTQERCTWAVELGGGLLLGYDSTM